ncbi:cupin domain-containing protein [Corynebacterium jeikeium]|uniref:cupin domain-containing protein n=1 Tax=Corynebacterium jeikeium TaxID=38289 RepID=UPI000692389B|nr:cupin domain-containing protein [Corynebacterium jeikeium]
MTERSTAQHTFIPDLTSPKDVEGGRAVPQVKVEANVDGARVVRIAFQPGDVFADHKAPKPILVMGQQGRIEFTVWPGSEAEGTPEIVELTPGTAIHVPAHQLHALRSLGDAPAAATLILLTGE